VKDGYRALFDEIHGALVRQSAMPREIFGVAGLVLPDVYAALLRDAPDDKLRAHMLRQTCRYLIDQLDEWEEHYERRHDDHRETDFSRKKGQPLDGH